MVSAAKGMQMETSRRIRLATDYLCRIFGDITYRWVRGTFSVLFSQMGCSVSYQCLCNVLWDSLRKGDIPTIYLNLRQGQGLSLV